MNLREWRSTAKVGKEYIIRWKTTGGESIIEIKTVTKVANGNIDGEGWIYTKGFIDSDQTTIIESHTKKRMKQLKIFEAL